MLTIEQALKLKRGDRVFAPKSGDTGTVLSVTPREDRALVIVDLDGGGWWTYDNFQIEREAQDE